MACALWGAKISVLPANHRFLGERTEFWHPTGCYVRYPSEGVLLGPPPKGLTPRVSAAEAFRSFKATGFAEFGDSQQPSVTLHTVTFDGNQFPAWVVTYRHTTPTSYGPVRFVAPSPACNFVGVYNLGGRTWATFFQDCPQ